MTSYCNGKSQAIVEYTKESGIKERYRSISTPIEIVVDNGAASNLKCWRFYGTGGDNATYAHLACGFNPEYRPRPEGGVYLYMDGVMLNPTGVSTGYFYVSNYGIEPGYGVDNSGARTRTGNCNNCPPNQCTIKIVDFNKNEFVDAIKCDSNYQVSCGEECPPGYCKCQCVAYPGYCCLPCNQVKSGLLNVAKNLY
jgi:hypothetical protein